MVKKWLKRELKMDKVIQSIRLLKIVVLRLPRNGVWALLTNLKLLNDYENVLLPPKLH